MARIIAGALRQILGLFIEDGSLAASLLAWLAAAYAAPRFLVLQYEWAGPVLFLGCIAILVENLLRTSRKYLAVVADAGAKKDPPGTALPLY